MRNVRSALGVLAVVATVIGFASGLAEAQTTPTQAAAAPTQTERDRARQFYTEGQAAFTAGNFAQAETAFVQAYGTIANPVVLLSIAQAQERQSRFRETVVTLEQYLRDRSDAPDRAAVQARIDTMKAMPGTLRVTSIPGGASVEIDGAPSQGVTPFEVSLAPGTHTVRLVKDGYQPQESSVTIEFAATESVSLDLPRAEAVAAAATEPAQASEPIATAETSVSTDDASSAGPDYTAAYVTASIGGAALIAGSVLGFMALNEQADFDKAPTQAKADKGESLSLFADVSFGVAGAALVTSLVLFFTQDAGDEGEPEATASLHVAPMFGPMVTGVTTEVRF